MPQPLDDLRALLATTPREREYLDVRIDGWSADDQVAGLDLLMQAAHGGDHRIPAVLRAFIQGDPLRLALTELLEQAPDRVRVEAGWELRVLARTALEASIGGAIQGMRLDHHGLLRAIDLLIAEGAEAYVIASIDAAIHEDVRTVIIERLWNARSLSNFPTVWWSGLGLLRRTLTLAMPSFRNPAVVRLKRLLASTPALEGFTPAAPAPIPPALRAAMDDVEKGQGSVPPPVLTPLGDEARQALLVYAADVALTRNTPRGVTYVGYLGGHAHQDLLEWARDHRSPAYAQAGADALAVLALAP